MKIKEIDTKNLKFVASFYRVYIANILLVAIVLMFISIYKDYKFDEYREEKMRAEPIVKILNDPRRLEFISNHRLDKGRGDFESFLSNLSNDNYAQLTKVKKIGVYRVGGFIKEKYKIEGFFWHDSLIFKFLNKMQSFSPGFLKILSIEINKTRKEVTNKPIMKLEVECLIFQR